MRAEALHSRAGESQKVAPDADWRYKSSGDIKSLDTDS
jgi:hypothetical protein